MDRRFVTVMALSLVFALVVSAAFYQILSAGRARSAKAEKPEVRRMVTAVRPLPPGALIQTADVKLVEAPAERVPAKALSRLEDVVGRPVISQILEDEPVLEGRLADKGAGAGLAPMIPPGMRAVSIKVNEVVGVAGFVLPGIKVDVLVTGQPSGREETITKTVLQNIRVLSAGEHIEPDAKGRPVNVAVVTALVTPEQAETLTLAGVEGRIQLVLRNGADQEVADTAGRLASELYGRPKPAPARVRPVSTPTPAPPPPAPPAAPASEEIVIIRGNQKSVQQVVRAGGEGQ